MRNSNRHLFLVILAIVTFVSTVRPIIAKQIDPTVVEGMCLNVEGIPWGEFELNKKVQARLKSLRLKRKSLPENTHQWFSKASNIVVTIDQSGRIGQVYGKRLTFKGNVCATTADSTEDVAKKLRRWLIKTQISHGKEASQLLALMQCHHGRCVLIYQQRPKLSGGFAIQDDDPTIHW